MSELIKIQHPESKKDWILIDSSKFDPAIHTAWVEPKEESIEDSSEDETVIEEPVEEKPKRSRGRSNG